MKTVDECMAEIARRSEIMIRKRKSRRNHILMACVPAVLLIGLCSVLLKPEEMPNQTVTQSTGVPDGEYSDCTSIVIWAGSVEVSGVDVSGSIQAADAVTRITELINRMTAMPAVDSTETVRNADPIDIAANGNDDGLAACITIRVTDDAGSITEYSLTETALVNRDTGESFAITEEEYRTLRDAMGVPID